MMGDYTGKLIIFEGIDGSGKSTLAKKVYERFMREFPSQGSQFGRYPTREYVGEMIRKKFLEDPEVRENFAEGKGISLNHIIQELMTIDRFIDANLVDGLWSRLRRGEILFRDRYWPSGATYFAAEVAIAGKGEATVRKALQERIMAERVGDAMPREDLVILVNLPVEICMKRLENAYGNERGREFFERADWLNAVTLAYTLLSQMRDNWFTLDCLEGERQLAPQELEEKVFADILYPFFERGGIRRG